MIESDSSLLRVEAAAAMLAIEYAAALAMSRPERGAAALQVDGAVAIFAGGDSPLSKCVGIGLAGAPGTTFDETSVGRIESFYRENGTAASFEISPLAPPSLLGILEERGYVEEYSLQVMTRPAADSLEAEPAPGIEIDSAPGPQLWAETVAAGFTGLTPELLLEIFTTNAAIPSVTRWLARIDGTTAGGATMSIHDGVAHLFGTSVLPDFRRRGIQRELLRARLHHAAEAGCDIATVSASPGSDSLRNLLRYGFVDAWSRTVMGCRE